MHRLSGFIVAVLIWCSPALSQRVDSLFIQDLDTLKHWVETLHPDAFARSSEELWKEAYLNAATSHHSTEVERLVVISEFLKTLKDSHTSISLGTWGRNVYGKYGTPEIKFLIKGGKLYSSTGIRFVELCGVRDTTLIKNARSLAMLEGDNYHAESYLAGALISPLAMTIGNAEPGIIRGKTLKDGEELEITIRTMIGKRKDQPEPVKWVFPENGSSTAYLEISSFNRGKPRKYYRNVSKGFKKLKKSGVENLVVDLRGNLGGSINRMNHVLRHLNDTSYFVTHALVQKQSAERKAKYKRGFYAEIEVGETDTLYTKPSLSVKQPFDGNCALLVDGRSASASVTFAAKFQELDLGPIFGTAPMGSKYGTSANPQYMVLPNSGIEICIATAQIAMDSTFKWSSFPITPTRWVELSEEDLTVDPTDRAVEDWLDNPSVSIDNSFTQRESKLLFMDLETVLGSSLIWKGEVRAKVFGLIEKTDQKLEEYDKNIKTVQSSNLSEEQIMYEVVSLQGAKKSALKLRNASIKLALPQELRIVFEELTSETRPAVLHFGIHNRADCNVCKK